MSVQGAKRSQERRARTTGAEGRGQTARASATRAERRAADRVQAKTRSRRRRQLPVTTIVGGALTVVVVAAVLVYAMMRGTSVTHQAGALTNPAALAPSSNLLKVGQRAPNFTLKDAFGQSYSLSAQRGHPVLLEFFAVWCPVCHAEAPTMARLSAAYAQDGVRVWSVLANPYGRNYDLSGRSDLTLASQSDLAWYATQYHVHHPQLVDPSFSVVNQYGARAYPGIYIIDGKGIIRFASSGLKSYPVIAGALEKALGHPM